MQAQTEAVGQCAKVNGINMYYEIHGTGQPLVLIHGGGSTLFTTFGKLLPFLAQTYKCIAVELQAHGRTSDRDKPESFEQDADDVAELLRLLNITSANIFGFSNGGSTALQIGIRHPEVVNKIVAVSAIYKRAGMPSWFWESMEKATFNNMPQVYKDAFLSIMPDEEKLLNMFNRDRQRMLTFEDWNEEDIKTIQAPTLVLVSDQDVVSPEQAVEIFRLLPNGRLAIFPGDHGDFMGEAMAQNPHSKVPELFVAMFNEFFAVP